jgi:DNA-binding LacI/PurR family transcriptional regulator
MGDIAAHLGVSRPLVSIVLRDQPGASPETRERVRRAAKELGYQPDRAAQMLRRKDRKHLGAVFAPDEGPSAAIIEQIQLAAGERGYSLSLAARSDLRSEATAVDELLGYRCDALIMISSPMTTAELNYLSERVPVVAVAHRGGRTSFDVVHSAGDVGIGLAVDHLVALGHRDIAYVDGRQMPDSRRRRQGYLAAMTRHRLAPDVVEIRKGGYMEEAGSQAASVLLARKALPTAVVAVNDHAALGLVGTLLRAGVSIPRDVSVTGYDDSRAARLSFLDLTSVRQDPAQLADQAVDCALSRIEGRRRPREHVTPVSLVVRSSTTTPRRSPAQLSRSSRTRHP